MPSTVLTACRASALWKRWLSLSSSDAASRANDACVADAGQTVTLAGLPAAETQPPALQVDKQWFALTGEAVAEPPPADAS